MKTLTEMSTKEIVAEFNTLTGRETKRFATRGAAEAALTKAREAVKVVANYHPELVEPKAYQVEDGCPHCHAKDLQGAAARAGEPGDDRLYCQHCHTEYNTDGTIFTPPAAARKLAPVVAKPYVSGCPHCNAQEDQTPAGLEGKPGEDRNFCHHCGTEYYQDGRIYKEPKQSTTRAASIAESWNNLKVAEARSKRHSVQVKGEVSKGKTINQEFTSVPSAFKELHLDHKKMIAFRKALVAAGTLDFGGFTFKITKSD